MLVASFIVLTLLAFWGMTAVYCLSMALVGRAAGITVERCSVGLGPTICQLSVWGIPIIVKPIPVSGYTKFKGFGEGDANHELRARAESRLRQAERNSNEAQRETEIDGLAREALPRDSFEAASYPVRVGMLLCGPLTSVLLGLLLLALPVWAGAEKRLVRFGDGELIDPSGVPDLRVEDAGPSDESQLRVAQETGSHYFKQLVLFRSLEGWGGYVACLATSGFVAERSIWSWVTCVGILALCNGVVNLLPVPVLNGGHLVLATYAAVFGRISERALLWLSMIGLALVLVVIGRIVWLDVTWLIGLV